MMRTKLQLIPKSMVLIISILIVSCSGLNFFSWSDPNPKTTLEKSTIDNFIFSLYNQSVAENLANNTDDRDSIIQNLRNRIDNSSGIDQLKNRMALITVYTKATSLRKVSNSNSTTLILDIVQGGIVIDSKETSRSLINKLFTNVSSSDTLETLDNAIIVYEQLLLLGNNLANNQSKFPRGYETTSGDYTQQALITGTLYFMVANVSIAPGTGTGPNGSILVQDRIKLTVDFINNLDSTTQFLNTTNIVEAIIGPANNPNGIETVIKAGGFNTVVTTLRNSVATPTPTTN